MDLWINGKKVQVKGLEDKKTGLAIANYLNEVFEEAKGSEAYRRGSLDTQNLMIFLTMADEVVRLREKSDRLDEIVREQELELYRLKNELLRRGEREAIRAEEKKEVLSEEELYAEVPEEVLTEEVAEPDPEERENLRGRIPELLMEESEGYTYPYLREEGQDEET